MAETMSLEEFTERVDAVLVERNLEAQRWQRPLPVSRGPYSDLLRIQEAPSVDGLLAQWMTDGSNDTCWDSSKPEFTAADGRPGETAGMDAVLEEVCPSMTFTAYRRLSAQAKTGSYEVRGYYEDRAAYGYSFMALETLYGFLVDESLILSPGPACRSP